MFALAQDKIDSLFELAASSKALYIPVDSEKGTADFKRWTSGVKLSSALKTVRSAKDFFFPKAEKLVEYKKNGTNFEVIDPRKEVEDFVVFGVRACDAKSFSIIDAVYLNMDPVDSYYKNRREHGTVITLACNEPAKTCFCSTYKIDAANPAGDVSAWLADGKYFFKANTPKGETFIESVKSLLKEEDEKPVEALKKDITAKVEKLPFAHLDMSKFQGKDMLKIFNSKIWEKVSETCLGCGTCTYVCPTCMCFDVRDFKNGNEVKQVRCWDSCMYHDFTQMAAANPRLTQKERSRQRFMHKLMYYPMAHEDVFGCVGCGRCLESCPINMNIVKVIKAVQEADDI
ncbi:4Fe-4S dicluster domain-containing protein [Treponema sp.]|uniref:4Fe-4S dicluster domain-containing protein n=1 Tax=Treponema sp. TaxID=166 RepID=UPI0025E8E710|nr:4Fe-4S dicluster domain-containing protein [Treponema sp.]MCR5218073.1 4Fe-4S dicluster domain-containing protein [Treponema sp.]